MELKEALMQMDALDDDQWTTDGAPKLDVLGDLVGSKVKRQDVVDAAPEFSKDNMVIPGDDTVSEDDDILLGDDEDLELDINPLRDYIEAGPQIEATFVPFLVALDVNLLNPLDEIISEQLDEAEKAVSLATELKNRLKRSRAYTRNRIKSEVPDMSNQQAIQAFIKSQTEARGAKFAQAKEAMKGVNIKSLDPRGAIDKAMARKNNRGAARPVRSLM